MGAHLPLKKILVALGAGQRRRESDPTFARSCTLDPRRLKHRGAVG